MQTNYARYKYTPDEMNEDEFLDRFVIREDVFEELFGYIKSSATKDTYKHPIILGQHGQGKTTLLRKISIEVRNDRELSSFLLPIKFAEEQYQIRSLCGLFEEVADYLQSMYEDDFGTLLDDMEKYFDNEKYEEECFSYLETLVKKKNKKLLILIDNLDSFLDKLSEKEQIKLRDILSTSSTVCMIGASTKMLEQHNDVSKPFYDFFQIITLKSLCAKESREFLLSIARGKQVEDLNRVMERSPARIETLRRITGGVPRTLVILFDIFLSESDNSFHDLLKVLDEATPWYKHRMDNLPPALQDIVHTMALHWDGMFTSEIAKKTKIQSKAVSAQLTKLERYGIVESLSVGKNKIYKIKERFFNIWYLMRFGRKKGRQRVEWLIGFLEAWYKKEDLKELTKGVNKGNVSSLFTYNMAESLSYVGGEIQTEESLKQVTGAYLENIDLNFKDELSISDKEIIDTALDLYTQDKIDKALELLVKSKKSTKYILTLLASLYMLKGDYELTEQHLLLAIEKGCTKVSFALARLYFLQGVHPEKALKLLLKEDSTMEDSKYKHELSIVLLWNEEFTKSYKCYTDVLQNKESGEVNNYLILLIAKEQYLEAKKILEMEKYQLKERYKPIWYALMSLLQDKFPNEIKKMGSELKESVDEVLKVIKMYKGKYAIEESK